MLLCSRFVHERRGSSSELPGRGGRRRMNLGDEPAKEVAKKPAAGTGRKSAYVFRVRPVAPLLPDRIV